MYFNPVRLLPERINPTLFLFRDAAPKRRKTIICYSLLFDFAAF